MATRKVWYTRANIPMPSTPASLIEYQKMSLWMWLTVPMGIHTTGIIGHTGAPPASSYTVCKGSSDGATAGMDGVFRPGTTFDITKWVRAAAGTAHTWVVLEFPCDPAVPTEKIQVCFDYSTANDYSLNIWMSRVGFTGGTTLNRPTATDEFQYGTSKQMVESSYTAAFRWSIVTDANGYFYLVAMRSGGATVVPGIMWFQKSVDVRAGDNKCHGFGCGQSGAVGTSVIDTTVNYGWWADTSRPGGIAPARGSGWIGFNAMSYGAGPGSNTIHSNGGMKSDPVGGDYDLYPAYVASYGTTTAWAGSQGGRGVLPDVYLSGASVPFLQTKLDELVRIEAVHIGGGLLLPFNASVSAA